MEGRTTVTWETPQSVADARAMQESLASLVNRTEKVVDSSIQYVAGVDASISQDKEWMIGAICLLRWPQLTVEEVVIQTERVAFPYVPGYLSFREVPVLLKAAKELGKQPDLVIVDGQGIAYPRRLGLASHLGLVTGWRTIGCAKSRLIGVADEPGVEKGASEPCLDQGEVVARLVRTRKAVKPVWVSIGHRITLDDAVSWVLRCTPRFRLPEPIRVAHNEAGRYRRSSLA